MKKSIFVFFTIFLVLFSIGAVAAMDGDAPDMNAIENDGSNDKSFGELQDIVNKSASGSIIYLNGSTFKAGSNDSSISINKDLTIDGASMDNRSLESTIDGCQLLRIMSVANNRKLTLLNINFVNGHTDGSGAVIFAGSYSTVKIKDCTFSDNHATLNGGVIRGERGAAVEIDGCGFSNNVALGNGGVISGGYGTQLTINDAVFINNTAKSIGEGGGVVFGSIQSRINISNSIFENNSAYYDGGVIYGDSNSIINSYYNLFVNSSSRSSGGVLAAVNSKINVVGSVFRQNHVKYYGGTIYGASNTIVSISQSTFEDNLVDRYGGAVYSASTCTISDSIFTNNTSNSTLIGDGGVIYSLADVNVDNCKFFDNKVFNGKSAVIFGTSGVDVKNSLFVNSHSDDDAGVIYGISGLISVSDSIFINSTCMSDGAVIYADQEVCIDNCTFINSTSHGNGGVIYGNLDITVSNSSFINSYANNSGGVIYGWSKVTVINSNFVNSSCGQSGGSIYGDAFINVSNSKFVNNSAAYWGGAINGGENADLLVSNSSFYNNHAKNGATVGGEINANIANSTFIQNHGTNNVLYVVNGEVTSSKFTNNDCTYGAVIYGQDSIRINNSCFEANDAAHGSTVKGTNITVESSEFKSNNGQNGGAIQGQANSSIVVNRSSFINNSAVLGGAIFNINSLEVYDSIFIDNTAASKGSAILSSHGFETISNSKFSNANETDGTAVIYLESSKRTNLTQNEISTDILPIFANGKIASSTILEFLNAFGDINTTIGLSAILKDDNGNIIGSDSFVNATIDNKTVIYNYDNETYSFKANHTMDKYGRFFIDGVCWNCDNLTVEVGTLTIYIKTSIIANDLIKYYRNGTNLEFQLVDVNMIGIFNQTIRLFINGVNYTRTTNELGFAKMTINLGVGSHIIQMFFDGYDLYGPSNKTVTVDVLPTIVSVDLVKFYRNDSQFVVTILEGDGRPLQYAYVKFNINGVFYHRLTKADGTAKLNINLNPGKYVITTMFEDSTVSNNVTVLSTILSDDLIKYYRNGSQFVVRALDNQGFVAAGIDVTFNINGVFYHRTADANGTAILRINLNPGIYVITTMVGELAVGNEIEILSTILSENIVMYTFDRIPFKVTVLDSHGNPAAGRNLTFNVNGVIYNRTSDIDGNAKISINLMSGKYIITTVYEDLMQSNIITII